MSSSPPPASRCCWSAEDWGRFIVTYVESDQRSAVAVDLSAEPDVEIRVVAGGQPGNFPARWVVSRTTAIQAATTFSQTGSLTAELMWEWT